MEIQYLPKNEKFSLYKRQIVLIFCADIIKYLKFLLIFLQLVLILVLLLFLRRIHGQISLNSEA